jgi:hypothetical protein
MKSKQQGMTMIGVIFVAGMIVFVAIMALKLVPSYIEYATIQSHLRDLARAPDTRGASVRDIISAFNRRAQIDNISTVDGRDIDIAKEGGDVVLTIEYSKRIPMVGNISACIDFEASSQ